MALTRTRRRILIAAVAVVGILVVWSPRTSRLDQCLVGTWTYSDGREPIAIELRQDGSAVGQWLEDDLPIEKWWTRNDRLFLYSGMHDDPIMLDIKSFAPDVVDAELVDIVDAKRNRRATLTRALAPPPTQG